MYEGLALDRFSVGLTQNAVKFRLFFFFLTMLGEPVQ